MSANATPFIAVTPEPITLDLLIQRVQTERDGAVSVFLGVVRDHADGRSVTGLEYSAYTDMAVRQMRDIYERAATRFGVTRAAIVHRVGACAVGTPVVAVVVASEHRAAGLDAVRFIIDAVKAETAIWKKEFFVAGGEHWVNQEDRQWETP